MPWILETMPKITKVWLNCNLSCLTLSKSQAFFSGGWTYKDGTWRITTNRLLQCTTVEQTLFVKVVHQHTIELLVWTEHRESRFRLCAVKLLQNNNKKKRNFSHRLTKDSNFRKVTFFLLLRFLVLGLSTRELFLASITNGFTGISDQKGRNLWTKQGRQRTITWE